MLGLKASMLLWLLLLKRADVTPTSLAQDSYIEIEYFTE
jgi:hypothetical protein